MIRFRTLSAAGLAACAAAASAQYSQAYPQSAYPQPGYPSFPVAPQSDADQLAQQLRQVAASPTDLYALLNAARLSLKVGDTDAAAQLYTRAERLAPANAQVKAGMARLLVQAERPGEALRQFAQAQAAGATQADFGSDRALAYDLIGDQARAQREYRAVLRAGADDEATRRYALSLGISGRKEPALALLDPLNRRSDRGAWRARAFVLAMNDGRAEADRIATTMMPPGMAEGLRPFFDRLPRLGATDRAFAVHFGSVRPTATRLADARLVPQLPALSPEPDPFATTTRAPVLVAAAEPQRKRRLSKRERRAAAQVALRTAAAPYVAPLPPPPAPTATQLAALGSTRLAPPLTAYRGARSAGTGVTVLPPPADAYRPRTPVQVAALPSATPVSEDGPDEEVAPVVLANATLRPTTPAASPAAQALVASATPAVPVGNVGVSQPIATAGVAPSIIAQPAFTQPTTIQPVASQLAAAPTGAAPAAIQPAPTQVAATPPVTTVSPAPAQLAAVTPTVTAGAATQPLAVPLPPPPTAGADGDSVLAAIVAGISVPESELRPEAAPVPLGRSRLLANIDKAEAQPAAARALVIKALAKLPTKDARGRFVDAKGKPLLDSRGRPLDAKAAAAWQAEADAKFAAAEPTKLRKDARGRFLDAKGKPLLDARGRPLDAKAAATKLAAAEDPAPAKDDPKLKKDARGRFVDAAGKPLLDARGRPLDARAAAAKLAADAKKPDPVKTEPQRYWVQVAGGADEAALAKEWKRVAGATPSLRGKQGWTTPLRATNRVLTGPFKTSGEAMTLVNQLKKEGLAAFMFTSDPGQKVTRLATR